MEVDLIEALISMVVVPVESPVMFDVLQELIPLGSCNCWLLR